MVARGEVSGLDSRVGRMESSGGMIGCCPFLNMFRPSAESLRETNPLPKWETEGVGPADGCLVREEKASQRGRLKELDAIHPSIARLSPFG